MDRLCQRVARAGRRLELSAREFALLEHLMRHEGQVLSRQQILAAVWDCDLDPGSSVVDVYVRYLRLKLDREGGALPHLQRARRWLPLRDPVKEGTPPPFRGGGVPYCPTRARA